MSKKTNSLQQEMPAWILPGVIVLGVIGILFFSWKAWTGGNGAVGPPKDVKPGMYDLRQEIAKRRAGQGTPSGGTDK